MSDMLVLVLIKRKVLSFMKISELFSVEGKVVLITGGYKGIGMMIARGFVENGAKVYITARNEAGLQASAAELGVLGECVAITSDLSILEGIQAFSKEMLGLEDRIDVLINNAGASSVAPFAEFSEEQWNSVVDINLKSPFFLTQALLPALVRDDYVHEHSRVINVVSVDGLGTNPYETYSYSSSKAGLIHLTRTMARSLTQKGVNVCGLAPGTFPSDINFPARDNPEACAKVVPAGRVGKDDDMAAAAIYLSSKAGEYVIGETLTVDGGLLMATPYGIKG